jgi:hypothetical protein
MKMTRKEEDFMLANGWKVDITYYCDWKETPYVLSFFSPNGEYQISGQYHFFKKRTECIEFIKKFEAGIICLLETKEVI